MIPGPFSYHRPATVADAVNLLSTLGDEARPLAGGHSLVPMMKLRLASPEHLIDLHGVAGLKGIRRDGNKLVAVLSNDYDKSETERRTDQVIAEHGTLPAAEAYFSLKEQSSNRGEVDIDALIANRPQSLVRNRDGRFQLFRVGDAVSSRNIHAALYDSLRLCLQF